MQSSLVMFIAVLPANHGSQRGETRRDSAGWKTSRVRQRGLDPAQGRQAASAARLDIAFGSVHVQADDLAKIPFGEIANRFPTQPRIQYPGGGRVSRQTVDG
jgi:hypothetical protein